MIRKAQQFKMKFKQTNLSIKKQAGFPVCFFNSIRKNQKFCFTVLNLLNEQVAPLR